MINDAGYLLIPGLAGEGIQRLRLASITLFRASPERVIYARMVGKHLHWTAGNAGW